MKVKYRIKKNEEFQEIIKRKHSIVNKTYVFYYEERKLENSRFGISVSKRMGKAVDRNKIKRQLRMILQEICDFKESKIDGIIIVRNNYNQQNYLDNKKDLESLLKKVKIK